LINTIEFLLLNYSWTRVYSRLAREFESLAREFE